MARTEADRVKAQQKKARKRALGKRARPRHEGLANFGPCLAFFEVNCREVALLRRFRSQIKEVALLHRFNF